MSDVLARVCAYHQTTKHHVTAYAPGPGFLDWDSQPDPFRRFSGAPRIPLPRVEGRGRLCYDELYRPTPRSAASCNSEAISLFLELSLGLSAWKSTGADRWALRNNPSSGNLHPTEGYLLLWRPSDDQLEPGLYHYAPYDHALERRARLPRELAERIAQSAPGTFGALGFSSIIWREEWKYGARAYRYCQLDVGHALGGARFAACVNGWRLALDPAVSDKMISACLGLDRREDFGAAEREHPDLLAVLASGDGAATSPSWSCVAEALQDWAGTANRLSEERVTWPQIADVLPAIRKPQSVPPARSSGVAAEASQTESARGGSPDACALIRKRRSAQRMDGQTGMARDAFDRLLARTLPSSGCAPFDALSHAPAVNLLLFVHAVEGLDPGLYLLDRVPGRLEAFLEACSAKPLALTPVDDGALPLYAMSAGKSVRKLASQICCHQGIAGRGAFSLGMIADFHKVLETNGAWAYRLLHWEAGAIGQVLYLEAEAAGLRGTGIGCYFDDAVHELLGLETGRQASWQSLYHFTVGAALEDRRLSTEPPYAHLADHQSKPEL